MRRSVALTLLSAALWGTTFPAITYALHHDAAGPITFAATRFVLAAVVILLWAAVKRIPLADLAKSPALWAMGVLNALGYALQTLSQTMTSASKVSLLVDINVVAVAILGYFFLKERHGIEVILALILGVVGVFFLSTNGDVHALDLRGAEFRGDVIAVAAGLFWSAYFVIFKAFLKRRPDVSGVGATAVVMTATALVLVPAALIVESPIHLGGTVDWTVNVYLAVFATVGAFLLWQAGLREISATVSSILLLLEIVVALAISLTVLHETLTPMGIVGAVAIIAAGIVASLRG